MSKTLQFKISLIESKPHIWRQFQVTDDYRLDRFHQVIQIVMGWYNSHLHEFHVNNREIGMLLEDMFDGPEVEDETTIYLRDLSLKQDNAFIYLYDFGDHWEHVLHLEKISYTPLSNPICTDGRRACPPEDCGGIRGYANLLETLKAPTDPEYEEWKEWLPENFNPDIFPMERVNKELKRFGAWHRKHPLAISTPWHQLD